MKNIVFATLLDIILSMALLDIVVSTITEQKAFDLDQLLALTCNADQCGVPKGQLLISEVVLRKLDSDTENARLVAALSLHRKWDRGKDPRATAGMAFSSKGWQFSIPDNYDISKNVETYTSTREILNISTWTPKATCSDYGLYMCTCGYLHDGTHFKKTSRIVSLIPSDADVFKVMPLEPSPEHKARTEVNYYNILEGSWVNVTCRAEGPPYYQVLWQWTCPLDSVHLPDNSMSIEPVAKIEDSDRKCDKYVQTIALMFNASKEYNHCIARCVLGVTIDNIYSEMDASSAMFFVVKKEEDLDIKRPEEPNYEIQALLTIGLTVVALVCMIFLSILLTCKIFVCTDRGKSDKLE